MIPNMTCDRMEMPRASEELEELSLLIPSWQILALAEAAEGEGMTVGKYVRRMVNQAIAAYERKPRNNP
jgi:hypothetical protein